MNAGGESIEASVETVGKVVADQRYQDLLVRRSRFTWLLTAIMLAIYFGYILAIAFDKEFLARPIGAGVTSIGIPIGIGVILAGIMLTGIYVLRANREFDGLIRSIREDLDQ